MSHFSVMVRVQENATDIEKSVESLLAPFHEFECTGNDDKYVQDIDDTEIQRGYWQTYGKEKTFAQYLADDGTEPIAFGVSPDLSNTHKYGYAQLDQNGEVAKVIRRTNPNKKWDYWTIGGRWSGLLAKEGGVDCCRISDLDFDAIESETTAKLNTFWKEWQEFCDGKVFDFMRGPRERALSIGLIECKDIAEVAGVTPAPWRVIPWDKPDTPTEQKRNRCDVLKKTTLEWLQQKHRDSFCAISTWARLDASGWREKGKMGWWASSDATPESERQYAVGLIPWLKSGNQNDFVVIVDCHI